MARQESALQVDVPEVESEGFDSDSAAKFYVSYGAWPGGPWGRPALLRRWFAGCTKTWECRGATLPSGDAAVHLRRNALGALLGSISFAYVPGLASPASTPPSLRPRGPAEDEGNGRRPSRAPLPNAPMFLAGP